MRSWLNTSLLLVLFFGVILQCCAARETPFSKGVTNTAEEVLCLLYIEGGASHGAFYEALNILRTVKGQVSRVRQHFARQPHILGAIESLLVLKSEQIARGEKTLRTLTRHLEQIKDGLSIALNRDDQANADKALQVATNTGRDRTALDLLSRYLEKNLRRVVISKDGNTNASTIRVLKTGAFLMIMLSTTADVCVVTGPVICFALYVAGSGALVVWFAQIYQAIFANDRIVQPS